MVSRLDRNVCIKKSTVRGAGDGLFSTRSLAKGHTFEVQGILIKKGSAQDRCTRYADAYKFRVGTALLIPTSYEGMINHSSTPNLVKVVKGNKLYLQTLRPIARGEELFFTYSRYAQNRFPSSN